MQAQQAITKAAHAFPFFLSVLSCYYLILKASQAFFAVPKGFALQYPWLPLFLLAALKKSQMSRRHFTRFLFPPPLLDHIQNNNASKSDIIGSQ